MTERTYFTTSGSIGTDLQKDFTNQDFELGKCVAGTKNSEWVFCSVNTAITGGDFVSIDEDFSAKPATTTDLKAGHKIGVVVTAVSAGKFAFAACKGVIIARAAGVTSADSKIFIGAVNGVGTSTATGGVSIEGLVAASAGVTATSLKTFILNWPHHVVASA